jgi:hypothetical protein
MKIRSAWRVARGAEIKFNHMGKFPVPPGHNFSPNGLKTSS